jgi:four helix bundle protein
MAKPAKTFQDLVVSQKAHKLVLSVYKVTARFPRVEVYGLAAQFRRAAVSVAANIAEGFKRKHRTEKVRFFNIAHASLEEYRYYLLLSKDLGYNSGSGIDGLAEEVSKLLQGYSDSISASIDNSDS